MEFSASGTKALKKSPLFLEFSDEEFTIVLSSLLPVLKKNGDIIFREGDAGDSIFILFSGELRAFGRQSDGTQRWLFDIKQQGEFFGEMAIIDHGPRSATITATKDSIVMMLKGKQFYEIISLHPMIGFKILRAISLTHNQWLDQSAKSYSDLIRWGEAARRRAITDEMTGLYNRRFLEESIKERFNNSSMNFRTMSLLMMDLDRLHSVNDRYGFKAGDLVITAASGIIRSCLRPGDIPARLSGDEFAVLLPDTDKKDSARVAERIRENIAETQVEVPAKEDADTNVSIGTRTSIGIATAPEHADTAEDLINTSDSALRKAKELGRDRVEVFS
jgi:diguanylate cyclase (GGDEF)-like protein